MSVDPLIEAITPKTPWYVVLRPFEGDGSTRYVRGEVVDTTGWMHHKRLVDLRYISVFPFGATLPEPDADGRRIIVLNEEQAATVHPKKRPTPARKADK